MRGQRLSWGIMAALLLLYLAGFALGWGIYASWHLLLVVAAILLLYNVLSKRGS
ncbi:MAG: hypothetical protein IVW55_03135 [Chloroflexi bacterium]|nr:hypothetical protein [Chloroflexota bacterium]